MGDLRCRGSWSSGAGAAALLAALLGMGGCGGEPPDALGGFELGLPQQDVMAQARERGGFGCRLRSSRPKLTVCEGPAEAGTVEVTVRGDSVSRVGLRLDPAGNGDGRRAVRRFVEPFGSPAWRDRPVPPPPAPAERYHTLWLTEDSARALSTTCAARELGPPCTAELWRTTPRDVLVLLDSLLAIRR